MNEVTSCTRETSATVRVDRKESTLRTENQVESTAPGSLLEDPMKQIGFPHKAF